MGVSYLHNADHAAASAFARQNVRHLVLHCTAAGFASIAAGHNVGMQRVLFFQRQDGKQNWERKQKKTSVSLQA